MKIIAFLFSLLLCSCQLFAQVQEPRLVKLKVTAGRLKLNNYFVAAVVDERPDTTKVGTTRAGLSNTVVPVNLPHGATAAIVDFIAQSVDQKKNKTGIDLHIVKWNVTEWGAKGKEHADLSSHFAFYKNGQKLMEYTGSSSVQAGIDVSPYIGKLLTQSLESVLKEFDTWWQKNEAIYKERQIASISVEASLLNKTSDKDHIPYSISRPLTIADFQAVPDKLSRAAALTYSGFNVESAIQTVGRRTTVKMSVQVYFDRSKSWMKPEAKNEYVLKHEQLHFDVTAIKTMEFVQAVNNYKFSVDGYQEELRNLHKQYEREVYELQKQYDTETNHGILKDKQKLWEERIKQRLRDIK